MLVLDRRVFGDAHRIVVLLGGRIGKVSAMARHARSSKKRFAGSLELFSRIEAEFVDRGKGGLLILQEASLVDSHPGIKANLVSIAHAGYLSELTSAVLKEGQGAGKAYELLAGALQILDHTYMSNQQLRQYELMLLSSVGIAPVIDQCVFCGRTMSSEWQFDLDEGGIVCDTCPPGRFRLGISNSSLDFLRSIESGWPTQNGNGSRKVMNECRYVLATLIDRHVDKKLKAREFLRKLALDSAQDTKSGENHLN